MDTPDTPVVNEAEKQEENNDKKPTGFQLNPENINRNGRPKKGYSISDAVKDLLSKEPERKKKIVEKIVTLAESGDPAFVKLAWNYMDGMPKQEIEQTGEINLNVGSMLNKVYGDPESESTT